MPLIGHMHDANTSQISRTRLSHTYLPDCLAFATTAPYCSFSFFFPLLTQLYIVLHPRDLIDRYTSIRQRNGEVQKSAALCVMMCKRVWRGDAVLSLSLRRTISGACIAVYVIAGLFKVDWK